MVACRVPRDKFFQFSWRPRTPTLLPAEQQEEILRNLKTNYSRRYEEEDAAVMQEVCTASIYLGDIWFSRPS